MLSQSVRRNLRKLSQKKFRDEVGTFLVEGYKGVAEGLLFGKLNLLILSKDKSDLPEVKNLVRQAEKIGLSVVWDTDSQLKKFSQAITFSGFLAIAAKNNYKLEDVDDNEPILILDGISDPGNLGTIIRTADWFGLKAIILSEDSVDPYNEKVVRSSMGSIFRLKLVMSKNIVQDVIKLKNKRKIIGLTMSKKDIQDLEPRRNDAYLFGSESHGIRPELGNLITEFYSILGGGETESLNVAVSVGIILHSIYKK